MVCLSQSVENESKIEQFSLDDLSALNSFAEGHCFVIFKGYFDAGNEPDSTQFKHVSLAGIFGERSILRSFEDRWKYILKKHGADYLHTTDALTFNGIFENGWNEDSISSLLTECAKLIHESIMREENGVFTHGIIPCAVTANLADFKRVQQENPDGPQVITEVIAANSLHFMIAGFEVLHGDFMEMFFDQGEPYRGHIVDRLTKPKFRAMMKANNFDVDRRILGYGEYNMRHVPLLQAADLLAWCVTHRDEIKGDWHQIVLDTRREGHDLTYADMIKPIPTTVEFVRQCKFPRRKPTR